MIKKTTLTLMMILLTVLSFAQTTIISSGDIWKYYYNAAAPAGTWNTKTFNDASWLSGASKLGNDHSPATSIGNNPVAYTTYFRHTFNVADASAFASLSLRAIRDDGIVVYLNGVEIWRDNMPTGTITHTTLANSPAVGGADEYTWYTSGTIGNTLVTGSNTIAIAVYQQATNSSDLSFDFELIGTPALTPPTPTSEGIPAGANWRYSDLGAVPVNDAQGDTWIEDDFNDSSWSFGLAELGYGETDLLTTISSPLWTAYFRKEFTIADKSLYQSIDLEAIRDDGMIVYLNGTEIWRDNMPVGAVTYSTPSDSDAGSTEGVWQSINIPSTLLVNGTNIISIEVHNTSLGSSDLALDFKLTPSAVPVGAPTITRGPLLQTLTPTSVIIKWTTNNPTDTKINYGTTLGALSSNVSNGSSVTNHEITLTGLTPNTKYYYDIADSSVVYLPENSEMYVKTAPTPGTDQFVRAWILGDAGTANQDQRNVRDAYYNYVGAAPTNTGLTDMMLFLGDNAYNSGTQNEYQAAFFDIYDDMFKKSTAWSCLGNHDGYSTNSSTQTGPYYDIFTFPKAGESGGVASGTEAYYSFDYANIHFIVLESYQTDRSVGGAMYNWAQSDIQNTTQDWIVVLFHHPPYTKGSHNSDTETELIQMRQNFMPMLEANGTDLVLNGHSHSYERSYFINGHQGLSSTFNKISGDGINDAQPLHTVGSNGHLSGKADTADGAYSKDITDTEGAVYITTGSAGKISGGSLNHAAMYASLNQLGSCVLEVNSNTLNLKFITNTGAVTDYFTIQKEEACVQGPEPTATNCWDNYQFNTTSCTWENQGSQPAEPTATNCWDNYQFNTTSCAWENQGSQPAEPTATNCWDNYQFNTTSCTWENQGSQPAEPTATNCWDNYQFNTTSCAWENQGSQPTEPTAT
ncbi:purple acid phosphatase family protein, partial [Mariniflexile soesokkakense]